MPRVTPVHYQPFARIKSSPVAGTGTRDRGSCRRIVTSVIYRKENGGKHFLVVDAAMNDLIRPALYGAYHEIAPVTQSEASDTKMEAVDVVGPVCESGDFFARDRQLPRVEEGDLLAILDVGAYGMALASNYNSRPRPAEILVRGKTAKVIRCRETVRELFSAEL